MDRKPGQPIRIFYSYAKEDSELEEELEKHLSPLQQQDLIEPWSNRLINAGKEWANEIDQHIESSDIILLLLSSDFFHSDYMYGIEMQVALKRQRDGKARVIPILLRPVDYAGTPISNLQALPKNGRAITSWSDRDTAFTEVARDIRFIVNEVRENLLEHSTSRIAEYKQMSLLPTIAVPEKSFDEGKTAPKNTQRQKHTKQAFVETHLPNLFEEQSIAMPPIKKQINRINYDAQRKKALLLFDDDQLKQAIELLPDQILEQAPSSQRWRIAALRGHCYFGLGRFILADNNYQIAIREKPIVVHKDQKQEAIDLFIHAAHTKRELGDLERASAYYRNALAIMDSNSRIKDSAEAHWGLALISLEKATTAPYSSDNSDTQTQDLLKKALEEAEEARTVYHSVKEELNEASLICEIALIEQELGNIENARERLMEVIAHWKATINSSETNLDARSKHSKEAKNVVSTALCYLAEVELKDHHYEQAFLLARESAEVAKHSHILRQAEAAITQGKILEHWKSVPPKYAHYTAEIAFRSALELVRSTEMIHAQIQAHKMLGMHLLKIGKISEGEKELMQASFLRESSPKLAKNEPTTYT